MAQAVKTSEVDGFALEEELMERAVFAALDAPVDGRLQAGLEAAVEYAETNPLGAHEALTQLRADQATLAMLEVGIDGGSDRATLGLGAAIELARAELSSPAPDLRSRIPEMLRWLEVGW